jgi:hypothetical protein
MGSQDLEVHSQWGTAELFHEVADEWRQLCERGPCNQPFFRPEWIAASIEAFASKHRLLLITVREGGRLRAVLPLLEEKPWAPGVPFTRLRSAADVDHSPRFDLIHGGGDVEAVAHAAWRHLKNLPHWDAIELVNVPRGEQPSVYSLSRSETHFQPASSNMPRAHTSFLMDATT